MLFYVIQSMFGVIQIKYVLKLLLFFLMKQFAFISRFFSAFDVAKI